MRGFIGYQSLEISDTTLQEKFRATYESAMDAIQSLKEKFKEISNYCMIDTVVTHGRTFYQKRHPWVPFLIDWVEFRQEYLPVIYLR